MVNSSQILSGATILLAIATVILAGLFYSQSQILSDQTEIMQKDFEITHRPWIGFSDSLVSNDNKAFFSMKNFGSLPNTDSEYRILWGETQRSREYVMEHSSIVSGQIIMPTQEYTSTPPQLSPEVIQLAKKRESAICALDCKL